MAYSEPLAVERGGVSREGAHSMASGSQACALSMEQVKDLHKNCMKLASENKINSNNSWSLKLIDHLEDIVRMEKDVDERPDFQHASMTIEAGVKIYSSRVDSAHKLTFKLHSTFANTNAADDEAENEGGEEDKENEGNANQDSNGNTEGTKATKAKKKKARSGEKSTLEPPERHTLSTIDGNVKIDPLFQKTSAQFDEDGTQGLLLNALFVHNGFELAFDSEVVPDFSPGPKEGVEAEKVELPQSSFEEFRRYIGHVMNSEDGGKPCITPRLHSLKALVDKARGSACEDEPAMLDISSGPEHFTLEEDDFMPLPVMDAPGDDKEDDEGIPIPDAASEEVESTQVMNAGGSETVAASYSSPLQQKNGISEDTEASLQWVLPRKRQIQGKLAWAGPCHWRFPQESSAHERKSGQGPEVKTQQNRKGCAREPVLDFENPPTVDESLFELPEKRSDISSSTSKNSYGDTLLPLDYGFQPMHFARLGLKPQCAIVPMRRSPSKGGAESRQSAGSARAHQHETDDEEDALPDAPALEDDGEGMDETQPVPDELVASTQIERGEMNQTAHSLWTAETAAPGALGKQVDVRKLKDALKEGVESSLQGEGTSSLEGVLEDAPLSSARSGSKGHLSVQMCFLCLLHLANEHNYGLDDTDALDTIHVVSKG